MLRNKVLDKNLLFATQTCVRNFSNVVLDLKTQHKMQAWQIHDYGNLSELQLYNARIPTIVNPDDLLIEVKAASLNPIDRAMIDGYGRTIFNLFRDTDLEFPLTLGRDFCGEIVKKGHNVDRKFNIGDKVYGFIPLHKQGSHAALAVANKNHIRHQPEHLNHIEAASIPYATMTAWGALFVVGGLLAKGANGMRILILGASGGVGTMTVQLLKAQGATVVGTCSEDAAPLVKSLGADSVYNYRDPNFVNDVAAEGRYDIILDCAKFGYENIPKDWRYTTFVTLNSPLLIDTDERGLFEGLAVSAKYFLKTNVLNLSERRSVRWGFFIPSAEGFQLIDRLVRQQKINPVIHKVFGFNYLPKGITTLEAGHLRGKIVIDFTDK